MYNPDSNPGTDVQDAFQLTAQIRQHFFPLNLMPDGTTPFVAKVAIAGHSRCRVARVQVSAHTVSIGRQICDSLTHRYVKVIWQLDGFARFEQGPHDAVIAPGHFLLYEASRPYLIQADAQSTFVTMLCEVAGHDNLLALAQRANAQSMPTEGGAAVALATVHAMLEEAGRTNPRSRFTALDTVTALLAEHVEFSDGTAQAARWRVNEKLLRDAQRHIHRHMGDSALSPDHIASVLNVCRRTLFRAFETIGESPQAMIQRLRLERCREFLSQRGAEHVSITQLALQFGFSDPAYFTRLFRQKFGMPPSQYRAMALSENSGDVTGVHPTQTPG